jgi:deoxyribose-phosphate aldolase
MPQTPPARLSSPTAPAGLEVTPRNPGIPLELDWIEEVRVNRSAVERRAATLRTRRTVKKEYQAAWLLRGITLIDLTTLAGDDTAGRVRRLCAKARRPVRRDLLESMAASQLPIRCAAVCVYHSFIKDALEGVEGSGIPVAAVSTGFPAGLSALEQRIGEIGASVAAGAEEIDVVITRSHVLTEDWSALYQEVRAMRQACGDAHIKTIIAAGELGTLRNVARASLVCMMAGADFIKTSTGKETINATLPIGLVMARAIRSYQERTGQLVGMKAAGGIRTAREALDWLVLVKDELGDQWLRPNLFRLGASTLLGDIERQLEHFVTGRYSAAHRHPSA